MRKLHLIILIFLLILFSCSKGEVWEEEDLICSEKEERFDWKLDTLPQTNYIFSYPNDYYNFLSTRPYTQLLSPDSSIYMYFGGCNDVDPFQFVPYSNSHYIISPFPDSLSLPHFPNSHNRSFFVCTENNPDVALYYRETNYNKPYLEYEGIIHLKDNSLNDTLYRAGFVDFNKKDLETVKDILRTFKKIEK